MHRDAADTCPQHKTSLPGSEVERMMLLCLLMVLPIGQTQSDAIEPASCSPYR